jgi:TRAP-type C4-dicarboxylate transport system permease small subunit
MSAFERIVTKVSKWLIYLAGTLMGIMMLLTMVHVVGRYGFNHPIFGQSELVGLVQVVAISFAGAYTIIQRRHVTIGLVIDRLSPRHQLFADIFSYTVSLFFTAVAAWQTFAYAGTLARSGKMTEMLKIYFAPFYFIIAIGWALLCLGIIAVVIDAVRRVVKK